MMSVHHGILLSSCSRNGFLLFMTSSVEVLVLRLSRTSSAREDSATRPFPQKENVGLIDGKVEGSCPGLKGGEGEGSATLTLGYSEDKEQGSPVGIKTPHCCVLGTS